MAALLLLNMYFYFFLIGSWFNLVAGMFVLAALIHNIYVEWRNNKLDKKTAEIDAVFIRVMSSLKEEREKNNDI